MKLKLYRLSLKIGLKADLFTEKAEDGRFLSREEWLRRFFKEDHEFLHRGVPFVFSPERSVQPPSNFLFGWLARERTLVERTPPGEGLELTEHPHWQAAFVAIDPTEHEDGQKIAAEDNAQIGNPRAILETLIKQMNAIPSAPYSAQIFPILEEASFWRFAEQHGNEIRSITFDVAAPNMFKSASDFQDELRSLRDTANVANVKATLESDSVLDHTAKPIQEIVDYTEKGAGSLSATATDGETYHSEQHEKSITLPFEHHTKGVAAFLRQVADFIEKIF
ncbi:MULTISPECIES: hypothetical protein [Rhizobium]|uniref:hypothetical protein n=1 Tax=Rhizobium TaxID=379 RepID=UPI00103B013A|nr:MULTISPECIES: hypothetical protein [Rhizobium]MDH6659957.1 hypothetical protein [Rhizobium sophorae]MBB4522266.1 hypothetical protein [Rhizobium leguminosarum]NKK95243.1 hypothetical protein [Rhizobium leguminosarum bv. viciae]TCA74785.1 hypothetical protein E0H74_34455 [Rhizobium leguminosarum bv. viciae]TCA87083.1 hypothetical protein E0H76_34915 [Rhizobium leguminosarum bv. viciae]